jgi:hypothetical protein
MPKIKINGPAISMKLAEPISMKPYAFAQLAIAKPNTEGTKREK